MERSFLEGLKLEAGTIDTIMGEYKNSTQKLNESISANKGTIKTLTIERDGYKSKADNYDAVSNELTTTKDKLNEYVVKEKQQAFHTKLKEMNVKENRLEAFTKLLGEDTSDDNIANLIKEYPEWVVETEAKGEGNDNPEPPKMPRIVEQGNPSNDSNKTSTQDDVQAFLDAWKQ